MPDIIQSGRVLWWFSVSSSAPFTKPRTIYYVSKVQSCWPGAPSAEPTNSSFGFFGWAEAQSSFSQARQQLHVLDQWWELADGELSCSWKDLSGLFQVLMPVSPWWRPWLFLLEALTELWHRALLWDLTYCWALAQHPLSWWLQLSTVSKNKKQTNHHLCCTKGEMWQCWKQLLLYCFISSSVWDTMNTTAKASQRSFCSFFFFFINLFGFPFKRLRSM